MDGSSSSSSGLLTRILSSFLNELDGIDQIVSINLHGGDEGKVLVLAACNNIEAQDEALLRPGRLQHHIKLDLPNRSDIESILRLYTSSLRLSPDISLSELADTVFSFSSGRRITGAHIKSICYRALISRVRQEVHQRDLGCDVTTTGSCDAIPTTTNTRGVSLTVIEKRNFIEALEESFPQKATTNPKETSSFEWQGSFTFGI